MRALTVKPEWAWAILHAEKEENRTWRPRSLDPHGWLAIHAGARRSKVATSRARELLQCVGHRLPEDVPTGALAGFAQVVDVLDQVDDDDPRRIWWAGSPNLLWCFAPFRLVLGEPIPCSGKQMLWRLGVDVLGEALRQLAGQEASAAARTLIEAIRADLA